MSRVFLDKFCQIENLKPEVMKPYSWQKLAMGNKIHDKYFFLIWALYHLFEISHNKKYVVVGPGTNGPKDRNRNETQ